MATAEVSLATTGFEMAILAKPHEIIPIKFFAPQGSDAILTALEEEVMRERAKLDISTERGRKAIASLAYKVSQSKTALDKARKDLVANQKEALKAIDKEGGLIWDRVEALQKKVRAELDEYEEVEKERVAAHEAELKIIVDCQSFPNPRNIIAIEAYIAALKIARQRNWEEFNSRAEAAIGEALRVFHCYLEDTKEAEAERAELERLRREEAERKEAARLQAIADEAAAKERRAAEERAAEAARAAEAERQQIELERAEAEAKAKQEEARRIEAERQAVLERERAELEARETEQRLKHQIERERIAAEDRRIREAEYAEQKRVAAVQEAERQLRVAEERRLAEEKAAQARIEEAQRQAERDRAAAVEAERKRVADEAERVRLETERREADRSHRAKVNNAALAALEASGIDKSTARAVISLIARGTVPHVTINY
jgi:colicin import membrane protein